MLIVINNCGWVGKTLELDSRKLPLAPGGFRCEAGAHPCDVDSMDASVSSLNTCSWRYSGQPVRGGALIPALTLSPSSELSKSELPAHARKALERDFIQTGTGPAALSAALCYTTPGP